VSGSTLKDGGNPWARKPAIRQPNASRQATPADRKKQLQQLAEMGVAVPDDFRKEMAIAGDWQVTYQRAIYDTPKKEEEEDVKPDRLAIGVRKRKFEGQEEEEEAGETVIRRGWGSTTRAYPGAIDEAHDLDVLFNSTRALKRGDQALGDTKSRSPLPHVDEADEATHHRATEAPSIKREETLDTPALPDAVPAHDDTEAAPIKSEQDAQEPGVVFKKRKAKPLRQNE